MDVPPLIPPFLEWLLTLLSVGLPGLPPGDRDPALLRAIPPESALVVEWAGRGGKGGAVVGIAGFVNDPEIVRAQAALLQWRARTQSLATSGEAASVYDLPRQWPAIATVLYSHPGCFYVARQPKGAHPPFLEIALISHGGRDPDATFRAWQAVLPAWMIGGETRTPWALSNLWLHFRRVGPYFVWSFGRAAGDRVAAALTQPGVGLPANDDFRRAMAVVHTPNLASVVWINLPLGEWKDQLPQWSGVAPLESLFDQLPTIRSLSVTGVEDGFVVARTAWLGRRDTPLPAPWLTGISPGTREWIPADAHFAASIGVDVPLAIRGIKSLAAHVPALFSLNRGASQDETPQNSNFDRRKENSLEEQPDFESWLQDLWPHLGNTLAVYSAPSTGGFLGLSPVVSLDVIRPHEATAAFERFRQRWQASRGGRSIFSEERFAGRVIYNVSPDSGLGLPAPLSLCLTDRQFLAAMQPQTLRAHLRFLDQRGPTFAQRSVLPAGDALAWIYVDSPAFAQAVWSLLPWVAQRPLHELSVSTGIDEGAIPSLAAVMPHLRPTSATLRRGDHLLVGEVRNPLSLAAPLLGGGALWTLQQAGHRHSPAVLPKFDSPSIDLGAPTVDLTAAEESSVPKKPTASFPPAPLPGLTPSPANAPARPTPAPRPWLPGLIRSVTPDDVEALIPPAVLKRLEEGPTPEMLQRREERRKAREARKAKRP